MICGSSSEVFYERCFWLIQVLECDAPPLDKHDRRQKSHLFCAGFKREKGGDGKDKQTLSD